jgi:hypothetical protein
MRRHPFAFVIICLCLAATMWPSSAQAQGRYRGGRGFRGTVFIGGYFYDPFYGPYPWWGPEAYPYPYAPQYADTASVRVQVTPKQAAVYVDGFYAGIVDDFDGVFQHLPLPPGEHEVVLYDAGYRTVHQRLNLSPAATYKIHYDMEKLAAGETSEPPPTAPPVPPPPPGSAMPPPARGRAGQMPPPPSPPQRGMSVRPDGDFGTLVIQVQPAGAEVTIDGERWSGSGNTDEPLRVHVPEGRHRVEIQKDGYRRFSTDVDVRRGETVPVNVSLASEQDR